MEFDPTGEQQDIGEGISRIHGGYVANILDETGQTGTLSTGDLTTSPWLTIWPRATVLCKKHTIAAMRDRIEGFPLEIGRVMTDPAKKLCTIPTTVLQIEEKGMKCPP